MRTTIDLPDELLRRAKATAAMRGVKMKDLIASILDKGLPQEPEKFGRAEPIPVQIYATGEVLKLRTNEELFNWLDEQDVKEKAQSNARLS